MWHSRGTGGVIEGSYTGTHNGTLRVLEEYSRAFRGALPLSRVLQGVLDRAVEMPGFASVRLPMRECVVADETLTADDAASRFSTPLEYRQSTARVPPEYPTPPREPPRVRLEYP